MDPNNNPASDALKREMYRLSQDDCMVYNPTDEDFTIEWEELRFIVPNKNKDIGWGKGKREVKRYLAIWYCKHMKDKLINDLGEKKGEDLISQRHKEGKPEFTDKYVENKEIWDKVPKTDDPRLLGTIMPQLFLGVVREFGMDIPFTAPQAIDTRSSEERVMEEISKKKYTPEEEKITPDEITVPDAVEETPQTTTKPQKGVKNDS